LKINLKAFLTWLLASVFGSFRLALGDAEEDKKKPESIELSGFFPFFNWCSSGDSNPGHPA